MQLDENRREKHLIQSESSELNKTPTRDILGSGEEIDSNREKRRNPNSRCVWVRGRTQTLTLGPIVHSGGYKGTTTEPFNGGALTLGVNVRACERASDGTIRAPPDRHRRLSVFFGTCEMQGELGRGGARRVK
jgi:hypothetical protein